MQKILVTGGAGFIGSSLVRALLSLDADYHVIAYDNLSSGNLDNLSNCTGSSNFEFIRADILDYSYVRRVVDTCDIIFHLAGNAIVQREDGSSLDYEQNVLGTYNILEAMKNSQYCKNLVYASTSAVYGEAKDKPTSEVYSPLKPISLYSATKLACEALICGYCYIFDISCVVARLANVIGPSSNHGVIYDFIKKLSSNPKCLNILGDGKQRKSYLYIEDCIDALIQLFTTVKNSRYEIFNIGSDDTITTLEIAELAIRELRLNRVDKILVDTFDGRGWKGDVREFWLDCSKLKLLGWKAKLNSRDAVLLTIKQLLDVHSY